MPFDKRLPIGISQQRKIVKKPIKNKPAMYTIIIFDELPINLLFTTRSEDDFNKEQIKIGIMHICKAEIYMLAGISIDLANTGK
jgi:hypothetical protein